MSDEDALLAAIAAHPDEDTPRLVYADWLDEHDRPVRAEFIRVQIEVARVETLPRIVLNRYIDVFRRQQELLDNHRAELLGPLAFLSNVARIDFHRGFVAEVTLYVHQFYSHRQVLANLVPLPRIVVADIPPTIRNLLGFMVSHASVDQRSHLVSAVRTIPTREELVVEVGNSEVEFRRRVASGLVDFLRFHWPRLDGLDISGCHLGDTNAAALLRAESFPILADLDLSENDLTDAAVSALLGSDLPRQLKRLILGGNPIDDAGAIELAERWPTGDADHLETLNLRFTNIGPPGQQALLARFGGRLDLF